MILAHACLTASQFSLLLSLSVCVILNALSFNFFELLPLLAGAPVLLIFNFLASLAQSAFTFQLYVVSIVFLLFRAGVQVDV